MKRVIFLFFLIVSFINPSFALHGPYHGMNKKLLYNLKLLEKRFGEVNITPHGGCRIKASKRAPNSYHLIRRGCRAADVYIKGVSRYTILRWWKKNVGGGRGFYCGRRFVHVDVGPNRTWRWFCRRKHYAKRYRPLKTKRSS